jgi:hypothetical protein
MESRTYDRWALGKHLMIGILLCLPYLYCWNYVLKYAIDAPYGDGLYIYWFLKQAVCGQLNWLQVLDVQHNEHRLGLPYALNLFMAQFSHLNTLNQNYASLVLMGANAFLLYLFLRTDFRNAKISLAALLPVIWLVCTIRQTDNLFSAIQDLLFMSEFFFLLCVYFASTVKALDWRLLVAIVCAAGSSFSNGNGLLTLPLGALAILANTLFRSNSSQKTRFVPLAVWSVASIGIAALYFWNYNFHPGGSGRVSLIYLKSHPLQLLEFLSVFLASPCSYDAGTAVAIGYTFLFIAVAAAIALMIEREAVTATLILPVVLFLYGFLSAVMATLGRGEAGLIAALCSRYPGFANYAWIGLYLILLLSTRLKPAIRYGLLGPFLALLLWGAFTTIHFQEEQGAWWRDHSLRVENVMQTYRTQGNTAMKDVNYDFPDLARDICAFYEKHHLSVFSRPTPTLDGVQQADGKMNPFFCSIEELNAMPLRKGPEPLTVDINPRSTHEIFVKGWAADLYDLAVPSHVFLDINGQNRILAASGLSRLDLLVTETLKNKRLLNSGFLASFKANFLTSGMNDVRLIVVSKDGKTYYETPVLLRLNLKGERKSGQHPLDNLLVGLAADSF